MKDDLHKLINSVEAELKHEEFIDLFEKEGFKMFKSDVSYALIDFLSESKRISKRKNEDRISKNTVITAFNHIYGRKNKLTIIDTTIGLLLGLIIPFFLALFKLEISLSVHIILFVSVIILIVYRRFKR